ncbi:MAG: Na+/H+ antiporter NhaA [Bacteroidota bacterium]
MAVNNKQKQGYPKRSLFADFFQSEKASGIVLIVFTLLSLLIANSGWGEAYHHLWETKLGNYSLEFWINDGLMAIFFLLVGLEIEREIYIGELSTPRQAILPIVAALGGMLVPAAIHFAFNQQTPTAGGFGIPMATDIAFALGILSLAGKSVPTSLKIFLTALAIIDDLGAILVIAIFYTNELSLPDLVIALGIFVALFVAGKMGMRRLIFFLIPGLFMWYFMHRSGVHATISGVLLAFAIPFGGTGNDSLSYRLQHALHNPVAFGIVPLFALANTGIALQPAFYNSLLSVNSLGIVGGLFLGKPLGILSFCWIAVKSGFGVLPARVGWKQLLGAGILAGIGFTMSIFITLLAFDDSSLIVDSKIAILTASMLAAVVGLYYLRQTVRSTHSSSVEE